MARTAHLGPASVWHADTVDAHIGLQLRARRLQLGLSEAALARRLKVSLDTIPAWEAGRKSLTLVQLLAAARLLRVAVAYFYQGLPRSRPPERDDDRRDSYARDTERAPLPC